MNIMKYYDADRFELEFDDDTPIAERDYYADRFKNVNSVANGRNHCTSCSIHIGTSPSAEFNLKTHSVLRVSQCGRCYRFYHSGTFAKDDDGNEIHCRWCGQGGKVYSCSACPYVFCEKCIVRNLTADELKSILSNDEWKCYVCEPTVLYPLRAQHWALVNFMKKQIKLVEKKMARGLRDNDVIAFHMKKELSACCPSRRTPRTCRPPSPRCKPPTPRCKPPTPIAFDDEDKLPLSSRLSSKRERSADRIKTEVTEVVENERPKRIVRQTQIYVPVPSASAKKPKAKRKSISKATSTTTGRQQSSFTNAIQRQSTEPMSCPSTSVGRGRTQLQGQMFKAMQMCRQVDEKLIELMNSKTYKAANSMDDINELYDCLSHLLTYTSDRVRNLKGSCLGDMRKFGFENSATDATDGSEKNATDSMDASTDENRIEIGEFIIKTDPADAVDSIDESNTAEVAIKNEPVVEPTQTPIILDDSD